MGQTPRMRRTLGLLALSALALSPVLAGCGGDDDEALSKNDFIEQADALCASFEDRTDDIDEPESAEDLEAFLADLGTAVEAFRDDLAELEPPSDGEDVHDDFVALVDETLDGVRDAAAAAEDGDMERVSSLMEGLDESTSSMNDRLADYGFGTCAEE
jgi:hypothetical protein